MDEDKDRFAHPQARDCLVAMLRAGLKFPVFAMAEASAVALVIGCNSLRDGEDNPSEVDLEKLIHGLAARAEEKWAEFSRNEDLALMVERAREDGTSSDRNSKKRERRGRK